MAARVLGFNLTGVVIDGVRRPVARFQCIECGATTDVTIKADEPLNPDGITNTAKGRGWDADRFRKNRVWCERCTGRRGEKHNDTGSELKKFEAKMAAAPPAPAASTPTVAAIREPTADQRAMIRKLLDAHFDEDVGCYLDGYTDEMVAEEAKVPRITVERIRAAAYGPIRVTPEMISLRKEVAELRVAVSNVQSAADGLLEQVRADVATLTTRLDAIAARIGSAKAA